MQISVNLFSGNSHVELNAEIQVRGIHNTVDHILIWNLKKMVIYEITSDTTNFKAAGKWLNFFYLNSEL